MLAYVVRRVLVFVPTLFISITLIFVLTRLVPGNPVWSLIGHQGVSAEQIEEVSKELGLDRSIFRQYLAWLPRVFRGDFGNSVFFNKPVMEIIAQRFPVTLAISGLSMLFTLAIAIPLGIYSATHQNTPLDSISMTFSTLGVSVPVFWLGFLLMALFAVLLRWFPAAGYRPMSMGFFGWLSRLVLPVLTLSISQIALLVRQTRASMLEILNLDYIVTARAKGLSEGKVIYKHALRNALIPIVTVVGLSFALSLSGSVIVENVFAIPGIGQLITTAAIRRDYPVIEGGIALITLIALAMNLLVDISYTIINPRIT